MFKMEPYEVQVPYKKTVMVDKVVPTVESKQVPREVASTKQVTGISETQCLITTLVACFVRRVFSVQNWLGAHGHYSL